MAKILFYCVIAGFLRVSYSISLKDRMDTLELQVSYETYKTKSDIKELRDLLSSVNATKHSGSGGGRVKSANTLNKLSALDAKLDLFMHDQLERSLALSKAITLEKVMTRHVLQIIRDLTESNTESVLEIEQAIEENEIERENSKKVWRVFEDRIKNDMVALSEKAEQLEDILENVKGGVIIQSVVEKKSCPKNWFQNGNTCYFYEKTEKLSWYAARIKCHDFGGKLSEPDTSEKMLFLFNEIHAINIWVGATDENDEGKWVWESSQEAVNFVIWESGQPNNLFNNQNCMEIGMSKMNDESCLSKNNYVCEKLVTK